MKIMIAKIHFPVYNIGKRKTISRLCHERIKTLKQSRELVSRMIADGKMDLIPQLKEEVFYQEMLKEYHL